MPKSIDPAAQKKRRRDAWQSAITATVLLALNGCVLLLLRWHYQVRDIWGAIMVIASALELGMILPVWILLKMRLKEIEGGEEDAATEY